LKTDAIVRLHDGTLNVFQNIEIWSDYKGNHEILEIKYAKSKSPRRYKIKDVFKFILINEMSTIVREYSNEEKKI